MTILEALPKHQNGSISLQTVGTIRCNGRRTASIWHAQFSSVACMGQRRCCKTFTMNMSHILGRVGATLVEGLYVGHRMDGTHVGSYDNYAPGCIGHWTTQGLAVNLSRIYVSRSIKFIFCFWLRCRIAITPGVRSRKVARSTPSSTPTARPGYRAVQCTRATLKR